MDGIDVQFVIALDKTTGKTVWKTDRSTDFGDRDGDFRKAYSTPLLIDFAGRRQLICTGAVETMSYDPATGKELWKVRHEGFSNTVAAAVRPTDWCSSTPARARSKFGPCGPTAQGDVTETHVAWKLTKNVPQKPSPRARRRSALPGQRRRRGLLRRGEDRQGGLGEAAARAILRLADRGRGPHLFLQSRGARPR